MSAGITFGSIGDIIAVGQIALSFAKALSNSKGSAKEYQALLKELRAFDQAILQVVVSWQNHESCSELEEIEAIIQNIVKEWRDILLEFHARFDRKYGKSLSAGGSGAWLRDNSKKISWLTEKEDVLELKRRLHTASDTITLLTLAAMRKSEKLSDSKHLSRVEAVHQLLQQSVNIAEQNMSQLKVVDQKIDSNTKVTEAVLSCVKSGTTSLIYIGDMMSDLRSLLGQLQVNFRSQQAIQTGIDTHWKQAPVTLEDAHGHLVPIPLELVTSWEMLDVILVKRFENMPGHRKIIKGEYTIEDNITGRVFSPAQMLSMCLRPGQKVVMSVEFRESYIGGNSCPRCGMSSVSRAEERTQCTTCGMWFQRVIEATETVTSRLSHIESHSSSTRDENADTDKPEDFQRVRLRGRDDLLPSEPRAYVCMSEVELYLLEDNLYEKLLYDENFPLPDEEFYFPLRGSWEAQVTYNRSIKINFSSRKSRERIWDH